MIISNASLAALRTNFSALYQAAFDSAPVFHDQLATTVPSTTSINTYGFLDRIPKMRKWVGPRQIQNLRERAAQIINEPYELTVGVDRDDIEDDNLGMYPALFKDMGMQAKKWPDQLIKTALQSGTTLTGFDAVPFFSALHPLSGSNQSNNFTGTALNAANYATVRAAMSSFVGADGEPLGVEPDLLVVPPQLEGVARTILNADFINNGETNVWKGSARLLVVRELSNEPTVAYMFDTTKAIKALVFQQRKAPQFVSKTAESDENVFHDRQFLYGMDSRGAVGYALWFLAARMVA